MEPKHQGASQNQKLYNLLRDGLPHSTVEILHTVYNLPDEKGIARISARIWDVQKKFSCKIEGWHDKQHATLYWYQLKPKARAETIFKAGDIYRPDVLARMELRNQMTLAI